jgi:hypothetical protein
MRWKSRKYRQKEMEAQVNTVRVVRKFLWWPKTLESSHTRWLEYADIKQRCSKEWKKGNEVFYWDELCFEPTELNSDGVRTD